MTQRIIYEDNHLIAVNKKPSWLVQGDKTGDESLLDAVKLYIKNKYDKPGEVFLGSIHRLDRPVSGLVIFARTSKSLERMNRLFSERMVIKIYFAMVHRHPPKEKGILRHYIAKDGKTNTVRAYPLDKPHPNDSKEALLEYKLLKTSGKISILEINPHTGRPHQIRVQLASMGCVIMGDVKYGARKPFPDRSIGLHSYSLEFIHPVKKESIRIVADLPDSAWWHQF
ncbi:MAG: RluA family pseudouridine synthase [Saprospiraceae bacterium]|nr:RluA family pseudouridine synthase [Saprospiraceae bacterium]